MDLASHSDVQEIVQMLRSSVECKDRKWMFKNFRDCFVGEEAVTWMCNNNLVESRKDAVKLGKLLVASNAVEHVTKGHDFEDAFLFYHFIGIGNESRQEQDKASPQEVPQEGSDASEADSDAQKAIKMAQAAYPPIAEGETELSMELQLTRGYPASAELLDGDLGDRLGLAPMDAYNRQLIDLTHPTDWGKDEMDTDDIYNMVVIGGGTAGLVTAAGSAGVGAKVAMIEKRLMGGDCLNEGCVPSKALLRFAKEARAAKKVFQLNAEGAVQIMDENGTLVSGLTDMGWKVNMNFDVVMSEIRRLRAEVAEHDSAQRIATKYGVKIYFGAAKFMSKNQVSVTDDAGKQHLLRFAKCCIATGAGPAVPPINGLKDVKFLTNTSIFNLAKQPKRLAVIGAGAIGCELGQAFQMLGSEVVVHLFDIIDTILPVEEPEASAILRTQMEQDGVQIHLSTKFEDISSGEDAEGNPVKVIRYYELKSDETVMREVLADEILVATGRKPNYESLNLEAAGVEGHPKRGVLVNDRLQTKNPNIYAAGDVCGAFKFTHVADFMARIVIRNALFFGHSKVSALSIPWSTFTYPEVAHIGAYKRQLESQGEKFKTFKKTFNDNDRAIVDGEDAGFVEIMTDHAGLLLGATVVSANKAGELISELSVIKGTHATFEQVSQCIHPYPTHAEVIRLLGDDFNRTKMTPFVSGVFKRLMAMQRWIIKAHSDTRRRIYAAAL